MAAPADFRKQGLLFAISSLVTSPCGDSVLGEVSLDQIASVFLVVAFVVSVYTHFMNPISLLLTHLWTSRRLLELPLPAYLLPTFHPPAQAVLRRTRGNRGGSRLCKPS